MLNMKLVLATGVAWTTVAYVVCFLGVALLPDIREWFMMYALHTNINMGVSVLTFSTFLSGLIIWDILALLGLWLFVALYNTMQTMSSNI